MNPLYKIAMMLLKGTAREISRQEREKARFEELRREQTLRTLQPETVILKGDGAMPEIPATEPPKDTEGKKVVLYPAKSTEPPKTAERKKPELSPEKYREPVIFFPEHFTPVSEEVPVVSLTSEEAVAAGYSFRQEKNCVRITNFHGTPPEKLVIPSFIAGKQVTEIARNTFTKSQINEVYIPGTIRKLGDSLFRNSTVKKAVLGDGITSIPFRLFYWCEELVSVNLPATLRCIKAEAFSGCKHLRSAQFPDSIQQIDRDVFTSAGIRRFSVESDRNHIANGSIFSGCPILQTYDIICNTSGKDGLSVLSVNRQALRIEADRIHFLPRSLNGSFNLDLSGCKNISFSRRAIPDDRGHTGMSYYSYSYRKITLPSGMGGQYGFWFPEGVEVKNYFNDPDMKYSPFFQSTDQETGYTVLEFLPDFFAPFSISGDYKKLYLKNSADISPNAINCRELEEIYFDYFQPEGAVFSCNCDNLRKVSWKYGNDTVTKYLPPKELVPPLIKEMLLLSFAPVSAPYGRKTTGAPGFKRLVYDRAPVDTIMQSRTMNKDTPYFRRLFRPWTPDRLTLTVTSRVKALIAVDILRSSRLEHEPYANMYIYYLMDHARFCTNYFKSISDKYPEYLESYNEIRSLPTDEKIRRHYL